jgi:23S rRNA-/tRNA-specific pseudouridylate synthase
MIITGPDGRADPNGVVIDRGNGFWVIDKPANVPVHATVDNFIENVVEQIRTELPPDAYVSIPQRLDQNTSGLFMVSRLKLRV